jgi:hypothetical protein
MELPLKVELPKLSRIHVLELFVPFVPGTVVTVCLMLGAAPLAQRFLGLAIGYRTKLALAVALTYVIGLAMMTVVQSINSLLMGLLKPPSEALPWNNSYWRRVAVSYVGSNLSPATALFSTAELNRFLEYIGAMAAQHFDSVMLAKIADCRKTALILETALSTAEKSAASGAQISPELLDARSALTLKASATLQAIKPELDKFDTSLRDLGVESERHSLYQALEFIPSSVQKPYDTFGLLSSSLQTAGVAALCMMIQYPELRTVPGALLSIGLVISTTHALWLSFRIDRHFRDRSSSQIAAMIQKSRQRPNQEASRAATTIP